MSKQNIAAKDQRTKRRIQQILKLEGAQDAASLAEELGITPMAVRQHLYALAEENLVTYDQIPRPKGRPAKHWRLSDSAQRLFPDAHAELSIGLIQLTKEVFGQEGLQKLIEARGQEQLQTYQNLLKDSDSLESRLTKFAQKRTEEGYMAVIEKLEDGSCLFIENHCPICAAANSCSKLCSMELEIIQELFPEQIVTRQDHILVGARRCAYNLKNI